MPSIDDLFVDTNNEMKAQEATYPLDIEKRFTSKAEFRSVNESGSPDGNKITLPIPVGLTFGDTAAYENAELGGFGGAFADGTVIEAAKSYIGSDFKEQASKAVKDMAARVGGNRVRAKMGRTPNPNTRALFKQVNLRTFSFTYKMIPESDKEAKEIIKIIKFFRQELYPEPTGKSYEDFQTGYFFPKRFQIKFYLLTGGALVETKDIPKIQPAYLSAITTAYNSGGSTMFIDPAGENKARFSEVDLSLTFMESRTLFKKDVERLEY